MGARDHAYWIVGAGLLALAGEGFQHVGGEALAHSVGIAPSLIFVSGTTLMGWVYSAIVDNRKPDDAKPRKAPTKGPKRKSRH